ncbi:MAG: hypothetical protein MSH49_05145 [[Eubacterium] saphenum]|nr:hypothetical protein [[Eubacterium] saphenum]
MEIKEPFSSEKGSLPPEALGAIAPHWSEATRYTPKKRKGVWGKQEFPPSVFGGSQPTKTHRFQRLEAAEIDKSAHKSKQVPKKKQEANPSDFSGSMPEKSPAPPPQSKR